MRPLSVIGNINIDIIVGPSEPWPVPGTECAVEHGDIRVGGAAGNSALAWMAMEKPFQIAANTGNDHFGQWLRNAFADHSKNWPVENATTAFSVGIIHPDGERTFFTTFGHLPLLSLEAIKTSLNLAGLRGGVALVVGSFLTENLRRNYSSLFAWLAENNIEVALDTGWPITGWTADTIDMTLSWLPRCRHLLLNEAEVLALTGRSEVATAVSDLRQHLPERSAIIVKLGARGAKGFLGSRLIHAPAPRVDLIDTIGAGDVFNAGYLAALAEGAEFETAVARGVAVASHAVSTLPRRYDAPPARENAPCLA
jgi:sugar/nucleoside kinase (ribokinase family)